MAILTTILVVALGSRTAAAQEATRYAPIAWPECGPGQVQVMILGTFHFSQSVDRLDIYDAKRQAELSFLLDRLQAFGADRIAVEYPRAEAADLDREYRAYLERPPDSLGSRNEVHQIGFRLARRWGLDRVDAVDVPMNLWHDSIGMFDERWPEARGELRAKWPGRYVDPDAPLSWDRPLIEVLAELDRDAPPANSEMYANFLPLVRGGFYVGALKLRPWYDRNLRIVQNLFDSLEPRDERLLLVIGVGHLRVLEQILELTPQLCGVDPLPYLEE